MENAAGLIKAQEIEMQIKFNALQSKCNEVMRIGKILHDYRTDTTRRIILEIIENKKYCVLYMRLGNYGGIYYAQNELSLLLHHW